MAINDKIEFKHSNIIINTEEPISLSAIMTRIRNDKRRDSYISEVLINLSAQQWISGQLKEDCKNNKIWGFGIICIFNTIIKEINYPAAIIDWKIFDNNWYGKIVRTKLSYINMEGSVSAQWAGV